MAGKVLLLELKNSGMLSKRCNAEQLILPPSQ